MFKGDGERVADPRGVTSIGALDRMGDRAEHVIAEGTDMERIGLARLRLDPGDPGR
jgi:hypothetical protein